MKKITLLLIVIFGIGWVYSCKKVNNNPVLDMSRTVAPVLQQPAGSSDLVLTEDKADSLVNFVWTSTQYNVGDLQNATYILQADLPDSNFTHPLELVSTTDLTYEITQGSINKKFTNIFGLVPDVPHGVEFRVLSYINQKNTDTWVYSGVNAVSVTTYKGTEPPSGPDTLWVPGDYQGWDPAAAPNVYSVDHDGKYKGYVYFPDGGSFEFKFTSAPDWNHTNFGYGGEGILVTDDGAGNLKVPGTGNYLLSIDTLALTWGQELQNFALIGSFGDCDWGCDEPLTWDVDNQWWTITMSFKAGDEFKWRANGDWPVNLGDNDPPDGTLVQDGANIVIDTDGSYTINLILSGSVPRYEIIQN